MSRRMPRPVSLISFFASESAAAAMEFAIVAPVLIMLLLGGFEGSRTISMNRHLTNFTNSVAWDFAGINDQVSGTVTAKSVRLYEFATRIGLLVPEMATGANLYDHTRYKIGFTMVTMTPTVATCSAGCTYTANVAWSWGDLQRACGALTSVANGSAYNAANLPAGAFQAGAVAIVDVQAVYSPVLNFSAFPQRTFTNSIYYPVRNNLGGAYLPWDGVSDTWSGTKCTGYP